MIKSVNDTRVGLFLVCRTIRNRHYSKAHCLPDRKSRGKLQEKKVQILGTGSVFQNSMFEDVLYGVFSIV
jgi:hypothetical protein